MNRHDNDSETVTYAEADAAARAAMARRPDLPMQSLDEWLARHRDSLSADDLAAAESALALFDRAV